MPVLERLGNKDHIRALDSLFIFIGDSVSFTSAADSSERDTDLILS